MRQTQRSPEGLLGLQVSKTHLPLGEPNGSCALRKGASVHSRSILRTRKGKCISSRMPFDTKDFCQDLPTRVLSASQYLSVGAKTKPVKRRPLEREQGRGESTWGGPRARLWAPPAGDQERLERLHAA